MIGSGGLIGFQIKGWGYVEYAEHKQQGDLGLWWRDMCVLLIGEVRDPACS